MLSSIMRKFVMIEHIPQIIFLINEEIEVDSSVVKRSLQFKYTTLEKATDYFNEANKLGQGGFGEVFKVNSPQDFLSFFSPIYYNYHLALSS